MENKKSPNSGIASWRRLHVIRSINKVGFPVQRFERIFQGLVSEGRGDNVPSHFRIGSAQGSHHSSGVIVETRADDNIDVQRVKHDLNTSQYWQVVTIISNIYTLNTYSSKQNRKGGGDFKTTSMQCLAIFKGYTYIKNFQI